MTEIDLVYKKLAFIETCVQELRTLGRPDEVQTDIREQRFEAYTLQVAIEKITRHHLDDLLAFVRAIQERLGSE